MRSGRFDASRSCYPPRIISACAERTWTRSNPRSPRRDHLRVCGADLCTVLVMAYGAGSSPRVRSGRWHHTVCPAHGRIISACAERTCLSGTATRGTRDHLRVCGADYRPSWTAMRHPGSSPRVRSGRRPVVGIFRGLGIISACAERTSSCAEGPRGVGDHLRVCGADDFKLSVAFDRLGSSPRVRSGLHDLLHSAGSAGIISACAERTVVFYCGLSRSGDMEYLIRALRGVGKRRGYQYLE